MPKDHRDQVGRLAQCTWHSKTRIESLAADSTHKLLAITYAQLRDLIFKSFYASLCQDEGRRLQFRVTLHDKARIPLAAPIDLTEHNLVKLAPTTGLRQRDIIVWPIDGEFKILGFRDREVENRRWTGADRVRTIEDTYSVSVHGPGVLKVGWPAFVELRGDDIYPSRPISNVPVVEAWIQEAAASIASAVPNGSHEHACELLRHAIPSVIQRVVEAAHGGCVLVVPHKSDAAHYRLRHPMISHDLWTALVKQHEQLPLHHDRAANVTWEKASDLHFCERNLDRAVAFVSSLAAVDGAVVMTRDLRVNGFGAEIIAKDSGLSGVEVDVVRLNGEETIEKPLDETGMRHRSAAYFCYSAPEALAIVVSQDGDVSVFSCQNDKVRRQIVHAVSSWAADA